MDKLSTSMITGLASYMYFEYVEWCDWRVDEDEGWDMRAIESIAYRMDVPQDELVQLLEHGRVWYRDKLRDTL